MIDDLPLFSQPRARARNEDPSTSHIAAREMNRGEAASQRAECLREVVARPGQTAGEIASALGAHRHMPSRRLPELREAGLVENRESRKCRVLGTFGMTWYPKAQGLAGWILLIVPTSLLVMWF